MKQSSFALTIILFLSACSRMQNKSEDLTPDYGLRAFLDVHSLGGAYDIPSGDSAYLVSMLEFEDGKFVRRGLSSVGTVKWLGTRTLKVQLLWGASEGKTKVALVAPGMAAQSYHPFWSKLDGGLASCDPKAHRQESEGFIILGFAQSDLDRKGRTNTAVNGEFQDALSDKKFIGALAVKTFKTYEDAQKESHP